MCPRMWHCSLQCTQLREFLPQPQLAWEEKTTLLSTSSQEESVRDSQSICFRSISWAVFVCVMKRQDCKNKQSKTQTKNKQKTPCFVVTWNRPARPGRRGWLGGIKTKVCWSPQLWLLKKWDWYLVTRHKNPFPVKAWKHYTRQSCKQYQTMKWTAAVNGPTNVFHPCLSEFIMCNLSQENKQMSTTSRKKCKNIHRLYEDCTFDVFLLVRGHCRNRSPICKVVFYWRWRCWCGLQTYNVLSSL